jgi:glucan phosphoethanolaminetransferase (alkaline phosphatase superfamily)
MRGQPGGFMRNVAVWASKWRWVLLLNACLVSPVLLYELRPFEGGPDKTILFTLSASVLWLLVVQLIARRIWITHALLFPFYLVVCVDLWVIAHYQTRLASSVILLVFENLGDVRGFVESNLLGMAACAASLLAGYALCLWKIRGLRVTVPRAAVLAPLAAVALVYAGVHHVVTWWMFVAANDRNSPFGVVSQSIVTRTLYEEALREGERAQSFHFGATRPVAPQSPELYVLVVGESSRRHNWELYGYGRDTNPRLAKMENLVVFRDVVTQAAVTRMSVPLILTRGSIEDEQRAMRERSIVSLFHEAGFATHWLSTQQRDPFTGAINRYPKEADSARFFERRHDGVLVDALRELLAEDGAGEQKMFVVIHTLGSHFTLTSRYPRDFARFPDGLESSFLPDGNSGWSDREHLVNAYDNTVLYTDHVLAELIGVLQKRPGIKGLFYVSDHGDNLRDDARDLFGHYHNNEYDLPIPMLFWYSDEYARSYPEKLEIARANSSRPLNTRAVFYSLSDLAAIRLDDPDLPRLSVFSPGLTNVRRMTLGVPKNFDFDTRYNARFIVTGASR